MRSFLILCLLTASVVASPTTLSLQSTFKNYPEPDTFAVNGKAYRVSYSNDPYLNERANRYLTQCHPDNAAVIISDLKTGKVLALSEISDKEVRSKPNICFGKNFPAASLIKVMTAAVAIEMNLGDSIPQKGSYHTLYRSQIVPKKAKHKISLKKAFAHSVNPAFAILGIRAGSTTMRLYGKRFGFNEKLFPNIPPSQLIIPDSGFKLAQASCGYTRTTTISPLHALLIARAIGDNGMLSMIDFATSVESLDGIEDSIDDVFADPMDREPTHLVGDTSLPKLQELLEATVDEGTASSGFHSVISQIDLDSMSIGGKTGTLCGDSPKGLYDWFIGYAKLKSDPSRGIAIAVMFVHQRHRTIKSNKFAAMMVREWYAREDARRKP